MPLSMLKFYLGLFLLAAITLDGTTIIVALISLVSTFVTLYFGYRMSQNTKATETATKLVEITNAAVVATNTKVDEYHKSTNSKVDELLKITRQAALAEGHLAGVLEEKSRKSTEEADVEKGVKAATKLEVKLDIPPEIKDKIGLP